MGAEVFKVNNERNSWHKELYLPNDIIEKGIKQEIGYDIKVVFKAPPVQKQAGLFSKVFGKLAGKKSSSGGAGLQFSVRTFWRPNSAVSYLSKQVEMTEKALAAEDEVEEDEDGNHEEGVNDGDKILRMKVKKRLETLLFSRAGGKTVEGIDPFDTAVVAADNADQEEVKNEKMRVTGDGVSKEEVEQMIVAEEVLGWEVWLDCLVTQIEQELDDDAVMTEVLRTTDMLEASQKGGGVFKAEYPYMKEAFLNFYSLSSNVLSILEYKAKEKWFKALEEESISRLDAFRRQNDILHDYACQLESEFSSIMQKIQLFKTKKEAILGKLAGVLDKQTYKSLDKNSSADDLSHLRRLSIPWPDSMLEQHHTGHV